MAENKTETKLKPSLSDTNARDAFIGIALGKLLDQAIALKQIGKYELTATHAVRYADALMAERAKEPVKLTSGQGKIEKDYAPPAVMPDPPAEPPKSIAELLTGPTELLAEV
jgi:hypothetical protein